MTETTPAENAASLLSFKRGDAVRVVDVQGGRGLQRRLLSLGLIPGADVFILERDRGPVTLCVNSCRVAVGRGVAACVLAVAIPQPGCEQCPDEPTCPEPRRR